MILSNRGKIPGDEYHISSPDSQLVPRFALLRNR